MKFFKRKKYTDKYLTNLIIKAGNLAQLWHMELQKSATENDLNRVKRIYNHIHRIGMIQQRAKVKLYDVA